MGLQSAMTTALTGLQAAETTIDVVGNNVANSGTTGFKESDVLFATQFLQTQSIGSAPSADRGGTNPRQVGLGVKVAAINPNFTQGTIEISANPLDLAIQGDGFLIVQGEGGDLYTRNGQIQINSNNELVTVTGNRLLGFTVDEDFNIIDSGEELVPLRIPFGEAPVSQTTTTATFTGVLPPSAAVGEQASVIESQVLGRIDASFPENDPLDPDPFDLNEFDVVDPPTVPTGTLTPSAGGSLTASTTYSYKLSFFVNSTTPGQVYESPASVAFGQATTTATDRTIDLTGLPAAGPEWDGRRLYRSDDGGVTYQLISDSFVGSTYSDTSAADMGISIDNDSVGLGAYSYYVTWKNGDLESRPTERISSLSVSDNNRRIRIDDLPQPPPGEWTEICIYRNTAGDTSTFRLVAELPAGETTYVDDASDASIAGNREIDLNGPKASGGTRLIDVVVRDGETYRQPFEEGILEFTGRRGTRTLSPKEMEITSTTTVAQLMSFMREAFGIIDPVDDPFASPGAAIDDEGIIQFTSNMGIENALSVGLTSFKLTPTGETDPTPISLTFTETQEPTEGSTGSTTDFVVYDSLGTPVSVRITTVMEEKTDLRTVYRWFATSEENEPGGGSVSTALGTGTISFDGNGLIEGSPLAEIAIGRNSSAASSPLEFELDFSKVSGLDLLDDLGASSSSLNMVRQDGFPPGTLSSFIVTESGLIRGIFSNGAERPLGQIRMARFPNNVGLQQVGENLFAAGINSGAAQLDDPGANGIGTLTSGALELSNTDIGQNLIELILASTQYRGGARVITTAQQLLDELLSLRR